MLRISRLCCQDVKSMHFENTRTRCLHLVVCQTFAILLTIQGCYDYKKISLVPDKENLLLDVHVTLTVGDDASMAGEGSYWFEIVLHNSSELPLNDCTLVLDGKWLASLSACETTLGNFSKVAIRDLDIIAPGDTIRIPFSHDTNNHNLFRDSDEGAFPRSTYPSAIQLVFKGGVANWGKTG